MPTPLSEVLDGAENDNFSAKHELWRRFCAARPDEACRLPHVRRDEIVPDAHMAAAEAWARKQVRGLAMAREARAANANLPAVEREAMILKGMIQ